MLTRELRPCAFHEAESAWARSFDLRSMKCLIVCRGPVRQEAIEVFDRLGVREYGMLLSEKDSVVYPKCLAPELRGFRFKNNIHRVPDYMGAGKEEKTARIREIVAIAKDHGYTHVFAGYGFMAEDAEFIEAIEESGVRFLGPASSVQRAAGAKDEAKKLARRLGVSVTPGVDDVVARVLLRRTAGGEGLAAQAAAHGIPFTLEPEKSVADNAEALLQASYERLVELVDIPALQQEAVLQCEALWAENPGRRLRLKYIGGGGGKGQRIVTRPEDVPAAVLEVLGESKVTAPGSNRNFLIELNVENTRHNEVQLIGNGRWCISLGARDCSLQMHEQKLLEVSLTQELLAHAAEQHRAIRPKWAAVLDADREIVAAMEAEAERFGEAVGLDSVSTFELIVDGTKHYFMEMNTRIQVEHRVTEMAYRLRFTNPGDPEDFFELDSLVEAMALLAMHGERLPKPTRVPRHLSGAEVRINATNAALQPHAGGTILYWSPPLQGELRDDQGIGLPNPDTGAFMHYHLAGAYDSNIALLVTSGADRRDNLERLAEILRRTELRGLDLQTNLPMHYGLVSWLLGQDAMLKPSTQFVTHYLAAVGSLAKTVGDIDLFYAGREILSHEHDREAHDVLRVKETLLMRPVERLFASPHLLAGFLGRYDGELWRRDEGRVTFARNPMEVLGTLYRYLNHDPSEEKAPSEQIWPDDRAVLDEALAFYAEVAARTGVHEVDALDALFAGPADARLVGADAALWAEAVSAHHGFMLGREFLLIVPLVGQAAGFFELGVDERLEPVVPPWCKDPLVRAELTRALAPPPPASGDEIVTPMGGHFYAREAPSLPPLVKPGDRVKAGQTLFIIEVMKMFNRVTAPFGGTILKVLVESDGKIVKKGQPIFKIAPDDPPRVAAVDERAAREARTKALFGW